MVGNVIIMIRDDLEIILGEEFRFLAIKTRERLHLTQRAMGDRLQMSESSYSDIERGVYTHRHHRRVAQNGITRHQQTPYDIYCRLV